MKDTTDYLQKMAALNPFPPNTTLVTMDVTSLYTNIPQSDGVKECKEIRESRSVKVSPIDCLVTMFTMVLKRTTLLLMVTCPFLAQCIYIYVGPFFMKHSWTNSLFLSSSSEWGIVVLREVKCLNVIEGGEEPRLYVL
jgi:hypothetical protein